MKKALIALVAVILLAVPAVVAMILYVPPVSDIPSSPDEVSSVRITDMLGNVFELSDEALIETVVALVSGKTEAVIPDAVLEFPRFTVRCTGDNLIAEYTVYMSVSSPDEVYVTDQTGKTVKGDALSARKFMETEYAVSLYDTTSPTLTIAGSSVVMPYEMEWNYVHSGGGFHKIDVPVSSEKRSFENVPGSLGLEFSVPPSSAVITVSEDGVPGVPRLLSDFTGITTSESKFFDVTVNAEWNTQNGATSYGKASYSFSVYVRADAIFDITSELLQQGEILMIGAKNATLSDLEVNISPEGMKVHMSEDGDIVRVFVSSDYDTPEGNYEINVKCGNISEKYTVAVSPRTFNKKTFENKLSVIQSVLSEENRNELTGVISSVTAAASKTAPLWGTEKLRYPTENQDYTTGWGITMTIEATEEVFRHLGIDCRATEGEELYAALSGKVVYAGKTEIWGGLVVIDHGAGLCTWYGRVDHTLVTVGQTVAQGELIAAGSDTGFGDSRRMHFGVSVGDMFVNPIPLIENGIPMSVLM